MDALSPQQRISPPAVRVLIFAALVVVTGLCRAAPAAEADAVAQFKKDVQPLLANYCYDCHADGEDKGKVAFDGFASDEALVENRDLWLAVLKNVRAGLMPPARKSQPTADEKRTLEQWIKY